MNLEKQVCSLELAKELKELGVKQESYAVWHSKHIWLAPEKSLGVGTWNKEDIVSAFTVAELGEMLPEKVEYKNELLDIRQVLNIEQSFYEVEVNGDVSDYFDREYQLKIGAKTFTDFNEANARAKMLIYLIKNKLI